MPTALRAYGDKGVYHRDLKSVQRTFPRTHTKVKAKPGFQGSPQEILKIAGKSAAAFFGVPSSYASIPITAMFSDFGQAGEERLNPERAARIQGYKSVADKKKRIADVENKQGQLTIR